MDQFKSNFLNHQLASERRKVTKYKNKSNDQELPVHDYGSNSGRKESKTNMLNVNFKLPSI